MEFVVREDSRREAMVGGGAGVRRRRRRRAVDGENGDTVDGRCDSGDGYGGQESAVIKVIKDFDG